jgi:chromosomal replication initiation ATPase DnaA
MCEEKEVISPYVFVGIRGADIPLKFKKAVQEQKTIYTQKMVIESIEHVTGISFKEIQSKYRFRPLTQARNMYCHYMYQYLGWTLLEIGKSIGGRDHTTVMHNIKVHDDMCYSDPEFEKKSLAIKTMIEWKKLNTI